MKLTPEEAAAVSRRNVSTIPTGWAADPLALARVIGAALEARGYRQRDNGESTSVYDFGEAEPTLVPLDRLRVVVRELALDVLDAAAPLAADARARTRVLDTAQAIREKRDGGYLRRLVIDARDRLPDVTPDDLDALTAARRARAAARPGRMTSTEYARASRDRDRDDARHVLAHWLTGWEPGRYELGDVWAAWTAALLAAPSLRDRFPGAFRVGRTTFYALLAEAAQVVTGGARRRFLVVPSPEEPPAMPEPSPMAAEAAADSVGDLLSSLFLEAIRERLAAGDRLGALLLQRDRRSLEGAVEPPTVEELLATIAARPLFRKDRS